jgi:Flp pilus assembly pilin Flp
MFKQINDFFRNQSGATLVEYGVALIMAIVLGGTALAVLAQNTSVQIGKPSSIYTDPDSN